MVPYIELPDVVVAHDVITLVNPVAVPVPVRVPARVSVPPAERVPVTGPTTPPQFAVPVTELPL
jgi:hypothetical protein